MAESSSPPNPCIFSGKDIRRQFLEASLDGDVKLLKKFAEKFLPGYEGLFEEIRDIEGLTALHYAATAGHVDVCKCLIKQFKFDINLQDDEGGTPLNCAVMENQLKTAIYLVETGASVSVSDKKGYTPLHYATNIKNKDFLKLLISRGADIEANSQGGTPLMLATIVGNREAVEFLLQNNANPNVVNQNSSPLIMASRSLEITALLVKAGADVNINVRDATPLHYAACAENSEITKYLVESGANPNVFDPRGCTPLERAAALGHLKAVEVLFPVTAPIKYIPDWTVSGILRYMNSQEAREKYDQQTNQLSVTSKSKGDEAFRRKDYNGALIWYSGAIKMNTSDEKMLATLLSNRSLCAAHLDLPIQPLSDAQACVKLRPDWEKAHYRKG